MKVYTLTAEENWICERFAEEWKVYNKENYTSNLDEADVLWILSPWVWKKVPADALNKKKVVITIHHIVKEKFSRASLRDFLERDQYVDAYHVTTEETYNFISKITNKPIYVTPFWTNQNLWYPIPEKEILRSKCKLPGDAYLIGSFQRDTEGHDLKSPKLEKGPDIFCDVVEKLHETNNKIEVVLAGWRRQYVMKRLTDAGIPFTYYDRPPINILNDLYNCLDLYVVSARTEGGPQAIVECALTETPIISTRVGIAPLILSKSSFFTDKNDVEIAKPEVEYAAQKVKAHTLPAGLGPFIEIFEAVV
jgi:glycosyltransferase involved in cell wall biosynthesis